MERLGRPGKPYAAIHALLVLLNQSIRHSQRLANLMKRTYVTPAQLRVWLALP